MPGEMLGIRSRGIYGGGASPGLVSGLCYLLATL
jgi:hypothetical protein